MTELSGEELDRAIAKVAGLVEGKQFGHLGNHHWDYDRNVCRRCRARGDSVRRDSRCVKPPPTYHESLDLIVPVVRKVLGEWEEAKDCKRWNKFFDIVIEMQGDEGAWEYLLVYVDNPARLLAEALVEAVGEKE